MFLNVQPDRGPAAARARKANDDPAAVVELDKDPLVLADAAVEIRVREVVGFEDFPPADGGVHEIVFFGGDELREIGDDFIRALAVHAFVIVTREEGAAVGLPEFVLDGCDARCFLVGFVLGYAGDDVQPGDDGPQAIFLADVVAPCTERFFAADTHFLGVHEGAEEFPAGGDFVILETLFLGYQVHRTGGRHAACETVDALLFEVRD